MGHEARGMGRVGGLLALALTLAMPGEARGQGWIEPPAVVNGGAVERTRSVVEVRIRGRVAEVEVSEWFLNRSPRVAEGHYLYPLPGESVFQGFSLFLGETELRGEMMDADRARTIYTEIVRRRADPALLEYAGHGLIRARIFPIEPGEERKVTLRYTQILERAGDALQLTYAGGMGDAATGRFTVVVEDGDRFLAPFSPTHALAAERRAGRLEVEVDGALQGRLSLFLPLAADRVGVSLATHRPAGEDGYFMLTLSPGRVQGRVEPRDVTVVLDVSGSMSGAKMDQARAALHALLGSLSEEDRFRLLAFANGVQRHREEWSRARGRELREARGWVDRLVADGGTNMGAALEEAFRLESPRDRLPILVFLTDGLPTVGEQSPERLADRAEAEAGRARIFAFGVGPDVNTHLLDRLGQAGRGSTQYVAPGEDVERPVSLLAAKIRHPVLTELELAGAPVRLTEMYPVRLPDLFAGEELVLFGRYRGEGEGPVRIRGQRGGGTEDFRVGAAFPRGTGANPYIPRLWASRKLGHLTRQIWTEGETEALVEEIRTLALRYGLPSPYTAYLVQEPGVTAQGRPTTPSHLPSPAPWRVGAAPAGVAANTGADAVRRAREARQLREASSGAALDAAEKVMQEEVEAAAGAGGEVRLVAGRVFREENGVWTDQTPSPGDDTVDILLFSPAYFSILEALPELRSVTGAFKHVVVHGASLSLRFRDEGVEEMDEARVRVVVERFRGGRLP